MILIKYQNSDIVINNAGILRDKSFAKLTEEDWGIHYFNELMTDDQVVLNIGNKIFHIQLNHCKIFINNSI